MMNNNVTINRDMVGSGIQWKLILGMASLALIKPLLSLIGLMGVFGRPVSNFQVTLIISILWIFIVNSKSVKRPVLTLFLTGITFGGFVLIISTFASVIFTGNVHGPITNIFAFNGILIVNGIWGIIVGWLASIFQKKS